ncbi:MAG: hypothetical protein RML72_09745 [Bacteroidia bacterium]|nr:hypothetical protein [Bacteroidia bacterium]MDW8159138.1 hypothetical protein [Bacteroidia bacterium]
MNKISYSNYTRKKVIIYLLLWIYVVVNAACSSQKRAPEKLPSLEQIANFHEKIIPATTNKGLRRLEVIIDYGTLMYPVLSNIGVKNLLIEYLSIFQTAGIELKIYNMENMQEIPIDDLDAILDAKYFTAQSSNVQLPLQYIQKNANSETGFLLITDFIASRTKEPQVISIGAPGAPYFTNWFKEANCLDILTLKFPDSHLQNLFFLQFWPRSIFLSKSNAQTAIDWLHYQSVAEARNKKIDANLFTFGIPYLQYVEARDTEKGSITYPTACYQYQKLKNFNISVYSLNGKKLDEIKENRATSCPCTRQAAIFELKPAFRFHSIKPTFSFQTYHLAEIWKTATKRTTSPTKSSKIELTPKYLFKNFLYPHLCDTPDLLVSICKPTTVNFEKLETLWLLGILHVEKIDYQPDTLLSRYLTSRKVNEPDTQLLESIQKALAQLANDYSTISSHFKNVYYAYYHIK